MVKVLFLMVLSVSLSMAFMNTAHAKRYGSKLCDQDGYTCYKVKKGDTWKKLFPDEAERETAKRVNRMNVKLSTGMTIAIPEIAESDFMQHAPFPDQVDSTGEKHIVVSLKELAFGAYDENGDLVYWGPISGGKGYCSDVRRGCRTPQGSYAIYSKRGKGCASGKYPIGRGGAPMPYCMFFRGGYAMHGSYTVPGYHASHGCVRMFIDDAKWLNRTFTKGESRVPVIIQN